MRIIALLLTVALLCTSCVSLPGEERCFAVVLCMELENGLFSVSARVPSYQQAGDYMTLSAEGETLQAALARLDAMAPMRLHYGQTRMVVFGMGLASSEHFRSAVDLLLSRSDFRQSAALCVTEDAPQAVCDAMLPTTGTRLSKSLDVLLETRHGLGVVPATTVGEMQRMGERQSPVAAALSLTAPVRAEEDAAIQLAGAWLIGENDQVTGYLTAPETQVLSLLTGQFVKGMLMLEEGAVMMTDASSRLSMEAGEASVRVKVRFGTSALTEEGVRAALTDAVFQLTDALAAADCDALGLARYAIRTCVDTAAWAAVDWATSYPTIAWRVGVTATGEARAE